MKKLLPIVRLVFFCAAIFAVTWGAVLLKQQRLFPGDDAEKAGDGEAGGAPSTELTRSTASFDGAAERDGMHADAPKEAAAADPRARKLAIAAGRALFQVPEPISISEASDLMNELRRVKADYEQRKAVLDDREKQLQTFEREIEARRALVIEMTQKIEDQLPALGASEREAIDPASAKRLAKIYAAMAPKDAVAGLKPVAADRAAAILLEMTEKQIGAILAEMKGDEVLAITNALLQAKPTDGSE